MHQTLCNRTVAPWMNHANFRKSTLQAKVDNDLYVKSESAIGLLENRLFILGIGLECVDKRRPRQVRTKTSNKRCTCRIYCSFSKLNANGFVRIGRVQYDLRRETSAIEFANEG